MNPGAALKAYAEDVREFYLLQEVARRGDALDAPLREELRVALRLADERREAAELLFEHGARAEALRLARDAYGVLHPFASKVGAPKMEDVTIDESASLPTFEDDVTTEHDELYRKYVAAHSELHGALAPLPLDRAGRMRVRMTRIAMTVSATTAVLALFGWWSGKYEVSAEASSAAAKYPAENAIDGNEGTEWLLPDKQPGYIDFKLKPRHKIKAVAVLNGLNPPYQILEYRLEAWDGTALVKSQDGVLKPPTAPPFKPPWEEIPFVVDRKVDKLRIVVKTSGTIGAGLAEVVIK